MPERWLESKYPTFNETLTTYPDIQGFRALGFGRRKLSRTEYCGEEFELACSEDYMGM
jgi:hypothetical protein